MSRDRHALSHKLVQMTALCWMVEPPQDKPVLADAGSAEDGAPSALNKQFNEIGSKIAAAKSKLDDIPPKTYTALARELDIYGQLKKRLASKFSLPVVTNATLKMYEMLCTFPLIAVTRPLQIRAFCNAELPGAFLVALNLYINGLLTERAGGTPVEFDWVASSYWPGAAASGNTYLDDKYGIYAKHRDRWFMGPRPNAMPDGEPPTSGDMTDSSVIAAIADAVHVRYPEVASPHIHSGATLYTSDAGIDVSGEYNRQEEHTALLNFGQVICGILSLAPGGVLVTKQYTFLTEFNRELITLLSTLFEGLQIVKPVTSRPANSEIYLIGTGFLGVDRAQADSLLDKLTAMKRAEVSPGAAIQTHHLLRGGMGMQLTADRKLLAVADELAQIQIKYLREVTAVFLATRGRDQNSALRAFTEPVARTAIGAWMDANPIVVRK